MLFGFLSVRDSGSSAELQAAEMAEEKSELLTIYGVFSSTVSCHIVGHCAVICSVFVVGRFDYLALKLLRTRSRMASCVRAGMQTGVNSPARNNLARPTASR